LKEPYPYCAILIADGDHMERNRSPSSRLPRLCRR
jgi:hypothetical protein